MMIQKFDAPTQDRASGFEIPGIGIDDDDPGAR